jgi:hypothetical protein
VLNSPKFTGLRPQTENPERRAEPRPRKGVKMAPISETEKDSLGLFSTGAHALASQTPIYSGVLTFPFEAHKVVHFGRWNRCHFDPFSGAGLRPPLRIFSLRAKPRKILRIKEKKMNLFFILKIGAIGLGVVRQERGSRVRTLIQKKKNRRASPGVPLRRDTDSRRSRHERLERLRLWSFRHLVTRAGTQ